MNRSTATRSSQSSRSNIARTGGSGLSRSLRRSAGAVLALSMIVAAGCSSSGSTKENGLELGTGVTDQTLTTDQARFGEGNIPGAAQGSSAFPDVHFDYDSPTVRQDDYEAVRQSAQSLQADPTLHAELEGHCDKRGTAEYNLALGEERAKAVAALLVSFGVRSEQLSTISYGEEIPVDPGDNESAFAKNRRVHFAVYRKNASAGR